MKDPHFLPKTLDEPIKLILLTLDEAVIFFVPLLLLGFVFNSLVLGCVLGTVGVVLMKKLKGEQGKGYWLHCVYWYLPPLLPLRFTPPSHQRDYRG